MKFWSLVCTHRRIYICAHAVLTPMFPFTCSHSIPFWEQASCLDCRRSLPGYLRDCNSFRVYLTVLPPVLSAAPVLDNVSSLLPETTVTDLHSTEEQMPLASLGYWEFTVMTHALWIWGNAFEHGGRPGFLCGLQESDCPFFVALNQRNKNVS